MAQRGPADFKIGLNWGDKPGKGPTNVFYIGGRPWVVNFLNPAR